MLRIFKHYRSNQVARYVKSYYRGRLYIQGVGAFEFDNGRLLPPKERNQRSLMVLAEVNREIKSLSLELTP